MFGKRFYLLTVRGIDIGVDVSWFFIAFLLTWTLAAGYFPIYYPGLDPLEYFIMGLLGMLGLFGSVVLHELGHALTARRFGVPIARITLFLFGGIAELKQDPPSPKGEFLVAVAGPIVSVALSGLFAMTAQLGEQQGWPVPILGIFWYLALVNLVVVIFNLIPAFPLDGGRMFRAVLWWAKDSLGWATRVSSRIGSGFGLGLIFLGIMVMVATGNLITGVWWIILGFFLRQAALMSRRQFFIKRELRGETVKKYMVTDIDTVSPDNTIQEFVDEHLYKTYHYLYPVESEKDEIVGVITIQRIKEIPREKWGDVKVRELLIPVAEFQCLSSDTDIFEALGHFTESPSESMLVIDGKRLVGLLSAKDLSKVISLKLELDEEGF